MEKPKILVIDDERDQCENIVIILSSRGYLVEVAYTAGDGVKKIKKTFFNIILLDMRLPDYDGIKVLERIKELSPDTEVVIFTAYANIENVIEAMDKEAFSYISKPFEIPHLIAVLKKAYEKQRILFENRKLFQQVCVAKKDWENTFDSISDLLCIHDENFNIVRYNKAFAHTFKAKKEDFIGAKCFEIIYGIKEPCHTCPYLRHGKNLKPETEEIDCPHMGGIFQITRFPRYSKEGKLDGVVHVAKDISKQKRMEEKLRFSYKMASLGRLTAGVFHEVLNPVNIISSHVQLLLMEAEKGSRTEKDLKSIQEEVKRIVKIIDALLRFSRKGKLVTEDVELNNLLEKVIFIVEPDMKLENVRFIRRFEEGLPKIMANSDGLRQVFLNLITNARDAMPEGGTITVKTRIVRLPADRAGSTKLAHLPFLPAGRQGVGQGVRPLVPIRAGSKKEKVSLPDRQAGELKTQYSELKGDFVEISFKDTGCGIAKENLDRVFDPFFTTKEEGKGVGLGMSTSYGIIDHYGGRMSVESEEGKGTTFTIDLPVKD
ncbi:MAG: two-component sensor kinase [Candidatus Scalindua rubra]|uniref:histidine kinase n=1 Tax=Candidatus Scalindua rubra TaxID=1872076 RepID=A0A1E3X6Q1_9BACT|nr:MAG: two-component sensor kinase [Candidatus Scalindua rubra]